MIQKSVLKKRALETAAAVKEVALPRMDFRTQVPSGKLMKCIIGAATPAERFMTMFAEKLGIPLEQLVFTARGVPIDLALPDLYVLNLCSDDVIVVSVRPAVPPLPSPHPPGTEAPWKDAPMEYDDHAPAEDEVPPVPRRISVQVDCPSGSIRCNVVPSTTVAEFKGTLARAEKISPDLLLLSYRGTLLRDEDASIESLDINVRYNKFVLSLIDDEASAPASAPEYDEGPAPPPSHEPEQAMDTAPVGLPEVAPPVLHVVQIADLNGESYVCKLRGISRVLALERKMAKAAGVPLAEFKLFLRGVELSDGARTIDSLCLGDEDVIFMRRRDEMSPPSCNVGAPVVPDAASEIIPVIENGEGRDRTVHASAVEVEPGAVSCAPSDEIVDCSVVSSALISYSASHIAGVQLDGLRLLEGSQLTEPPAVVSEVLSLRETPGSSEAPAADTVDVKFNCVFNRMVYTCQVPLYLTVEDVLCYLVEDVGLDSAGLVLNFNDQDVADQKLTLASLGVLEGSEIKIRKIIIKAEAPSPLKAAETTSNEKPDVARETVDKRDTVLGEEVMAVDAEARVEVEVCEGARDPTVAMGGAADEDHIDASGGVAGAAALETDAAEESSGAFVHGKDAAPIADKGVILGEGNIVVAGYEVEGAAIDEAVESVQEHWDDEMSLNQEGVYNSDDGSFFCIKCQCILSKDNFSIRMAAMRSSERICLRHSYMRSPTRMSGENHDHSIDAAEGMVEVTSTAAAAQSLEA